MSSSSASLVANSSFYNKNCTFQDDSYLPIALTALPGVGTIVQIFKEITIALKIKELRDPDEDAQAAKGAIAKLVETKNKYIYATIARQLLVTIGLIVGVACSVFNPVVAGIFISLYLISAALNAYRVHRNITHIINPHNEGRPIDPMKIL